MAGYQAPRNRTRRDGVRSQIGRPSAAFWLKVLLCLGVSAIHAAETGVQGHWAFTRPSAHDPAEHLATTPSTEDSDTWLLVACNSERRLLVALMHAGPVPFPGDGLSHVTVRSTRFTNLPVTAKSAQPNQIFIDPAVMRQALPLLFDEDRFVVSVAERNGSLHDYTFLMQPNDVALGPIRSRCLDIGKGS